MSLNIIASFKVGSLSPLLVTGMATHSENASQITMEY
jgi:hypothetical protein